MDTTNGTEPQGISQSRHPMSPQSEDVLNDINIIKLQERGNSAGTPTLQVMRQPSLLLKKWTQVYPLLAGLLGSPQRAEMTRVALRTQALRGRCFKKAKTIGASCNYIPLSGPQAVPVELILLNPWAVQRVGSEKTWDRCLAKLRALGLVETQRLAWGQGMTTKDGKKQLAGLRATNLIDFRKLWALLVKLLMAESRETKGRGQNVLFRVHGVWATLAQAMTLPFRTDMPPGKRNPGRAFGCLWSRTGNSAVRGTR